MTSKRFRAELRFEEKLLKKFPDSYIPYYLLGITYAEFEGNIENKELREFYYRKSIEYHRKALSICKHEIAQRNIERYIRLTEKYHKMSYFQARVEELNHKLDQKYISLKFKLTQEIPNDVREFLGKFRP